MSGVPVRRAPVLRRLFPELQSGVAIAFHPRFFLPHTIFGPELLLLECLRVCSVRVGHGGRGVGAGLPLRHQGLQLRGRDIVPFRLLVQEIGH